MKIFEKFNAKIHIPVLMVLSLVILQLRVYYKNQVLNECTKITVASPYEIGGGYKTGYNMYYTYTLNSTQIKDYDGVDKGDYNANGESYYLKKRFFLKVSCNDVKNTKIIWSVLVPDTLNYVPANGWDKIPYNLGK